MTWEIFTELMSDIAAVLRKRRAALRLPEDFPSTVLGDCQISHLTVGHSEPFTLADGTEVRLKSPMERIGGMLPHPSRSHRQNVGDVATNAGLKDSLRLATRSSTARTP